MKERLARLAADGFTILPQVYSDREMAEQGEQLDLALQSAPQDDRSIRQRNGKVYAARDALTLLPSAKTIWRRPALTELLTQVLGESCGLVRALYFNKPPTRSWSLPWHKDMTIAVLRNDLPSHKFGKPTTKAGVAHVEAPESVLQAMLTLRIHVDKATVENGPLNVIPGSHRSGKRPVAAGSGLTTVLAEAGDVLAMRPLLTHSSNNSSPQTNLQRRILHLEFAAAPELDDGYRWRHFQSVAG